MNRYLIVYKKKDSDDILNKKISAINICDAYLKIENGSIIINIINLYS